MKMDERKWTLGDLNVALRRGKQNVCSRHKALCGQGLQTFGYLQNLVSINSHTKFEV